MYTDDREFSCFDFHDSYFEKVVVKDNCCSWYLEAVNVLTECSQNPCTCNMMASLMKIEFEDFYLEGEPVDFNRVCEEGCEILEVKHLGLQNGIDTYLFCIVGSEYKELQISFKRVRFEWEEYLAKAWYVYWEEEALIKEFLTKNPQIPWMCLNNEQRNRMAGEYYKEITKGHALFGLEAMVLAKSEATDEILCSMSDGSSVVIHLNYGKQQMKGYPKFTKFDSMELALHTISIAYN